MGMRATIKLIFGGERQKIEQSFQGSIDDRGTFTANHGGPGARPLRIANAWSQVVDVYDDGADGEKREVHIGPGVKFHAGNATFMQAGGKIVMEQIGFNGKPEITPVNYSTVVGGIMPPTRFRATGTNGIQIKK